MTEMKIEFYKASASADNDNCVELGETVHGDVLIRDSKDRGHGPVLRSTKNGLAALLEGAKRGEFDRLL